MMKRKNLILLFLTITIVFIVYRVYRAPVTKEVVFDTDNQNQQIHRDKKIPFSLKIREKDKPAKVNRIVESRDQEFQVYDQLEKKWLDKVEDLIGPDKFSLYLEMRERNDKEKMQAYKEYHDYLRLKFGDNFSYNISEDQSVREKVINQRYQAELLKLIGKDLFKSYINLRDQFNEEMRRSGKEAIQIEF